MFSVYSLQMLLCYLVGILDDANIYRWAMSHYLLLTDSLHVKNSWLTSIVEFSRILVLLAKCFMIRKGKIQNHSTFFSLLCRLWQFVHNIFLGSYNRNALKGFFHAP